MIFLLIFAVGLVAGFVDAIAGGGGLIMLPGLLFAGLPVGSAIATNKLCGTFGALTSTLKFAQTKQIDWQAITLMAIPVIIGAYIGSRSIDRLPNTWAEPLVILLMVAITTFVILKPDFGTNKTIEKIDALSPKPAPYRTLWRILAATAIGFHDGFFGPGTGIFLVFTLLTLWPIDFLKATGTTKLLNFLANLTALISFAISGTILYAYGIAGAIGVILGSYIGATFATQKGTKVIRPIFIVVTTALVIKLALSYLNT